MIARLLDVPVEVAGTQDHDDPDGYQDADREDYYFHIGPPLVFYYCRRPRAYHATPLTTSPFCRLAERVLPVKRLALARSPAGRCGAGSPPARFPHYGEADACLGSVIRP